MGSLDDLSPDQRAVVALLLQQGKRYDELASLLRIDAAAVRQRAAGALDALGRAGGAPEPPEAQRAVLADWLLGQQDGAAAEASAAIAASEPARSWASAVAQALRPIGGERVPEVPEPAAPPQPPEAAPAEPAEATPPQPAEAAPAEPADAAPLPGFGPPPPGGDGPRASRLGGALLILGLAAIVAVVLIIVLSGGGDDNGATGTAAATQTTSTTATTQAQPTIEGQVNLRAPGGGSALGVANIIAQGEQRALALRAQGLEPNTKRNAYAVWLAGGPNGAVKRLGFAPVVGRNGRLEGVAALPDDARDYARLELSLETSADPKEPTDVVLRGRF